MKNVIMILMAVVFVVMGADKITKPFTFTSGTAALASQVNKNYDSIIVPTNKLIDTVNQKVPRWAGVLRNYDSTTTYINIDTIKGPVKIDTIVGGSKFTVDSVIGAVRGNVTGNASGTAATVTGAAQPAITSVGTLTGLTSSGTVSVDSLYSTKGVKATGGTFSAGVSGTTGTFTGTVNVDTLKSTKGISATNATFSTNLTVTGKINCDTLVGALTVDSLRFGANNWIKRITTASGRMSSGSATINYPTGFTYSNTVVIGITSRDSSESKYIDWHDVPGGGAKEVKLNSASMFLYQTGLSGSCANDSIYVTLMNR